MSSSTTATNDISSSETTTTRPGVRRTILQSHEIPALPGYESRLVLLEYPPGLAAPVHSHPVAGIGYILEGNVVSQWEGGEVERYGPGDTFIDLGETVHVRSENVTVVKVEEGDGERGWLKMLVFYVIRVGEANVRL